MNPPRAKPESVDAYIAGFPEDVQVILRRMRETIREAIPGAEEKVSYQIPTYTLGGRYVVYFAGFARHASVFPAPIGNPDFPGDLAPYASGRGTAKFPLTKPIPYELIGDIARFLAAESVKRAK